MRVPENCDRCGGDLHIGGNKTWIMSWFTEEEICQDCEFKENEIKEALRQQGRDTRDFEGCGYIPRISNSAKFIEK